MNIYTFKKSVAMSVVALALCGCSDTSVPDGDSVESGVSRLRFSVADGVIVEPAIEKTRSTNLDFQNGTFADGTEIGIFIVKEEAYDSFLAATDLPYSNGGPTAAPLPEAGGALPEDGVSEASSEYTWLISGAYADGVHYGYENIRAVIGSDGRITRPDGLEFIYPLHTADRVAIIAYAPYSEEVSYESLKSGIRAAVSAGQGDDGGLQASDLLIGLPSVGNPLRLDADVPVSLRFSHVMSSVQLHLAIARTPELCSESIVVRLRNMTACDTLLVMPTAEAYNGVTVADGAEGVFLGFADGLQPSVTDVTMASVEGFATPSVVDTLRLSCNALVLPQTFDSEQPPVFEIIFKNRANGLADTTVVRTDPRDAVRYRSGRLNLYRAYLPARPGGDDHQEPLPDEGKDDIILGAPKKH